jgi:hypothetical protein
MGPDGPQSGRRRGPAHRAAGRGGAAVWASHAAAGAGLVLGLVGFLQTLAAAHGVASVPVGAWIGLAATLVATAAAWRRWPVLLLAAAFAHNASQSLPVLIGALCFFAAALITWFSSRRRNHRVPRADGAAA